MSKLTIEDIMPYIPFGLKAKVKGKSDEIWTVEGKNIDGLLEMSLDENTTGGLGYAVIIVCVIIVLTSIFCIKNSFDISITEKIKQYGMLRSIGATKKQIKRNVYFYH